MIVKTNKRYKAEIQAARQEGERSVLLSPNLNYGSSETSTKNNYITYEKQVEELYSMYYAQSELGADITKAIIDIRTAIITGEGITINAKRKKTGEWINDFLKKNGLQNTKLISCVKHGELEGKQLLLLKPVIKKDGEIINNDKSFIKVLQILWKDTKYNVELNDLDYEEIKSITVSIDEKTKNYPLDKAVFVKLNGKPTDAKNTPSRSANIIQQIKNYDKALYDLRSNNKLFGFSMLGFKCENSESAAEIQTQIKNGTWAPGKSFAGTAQMYFPIPPNAYETLSKEMSINAKIISSTTGVLVHWLGWTDLMSNRSVAEELEELVKASTSSDRLVWEQSIKELIIKAMRLSIDELGDSVQYDEEFEVDIPYISLQYVNLLSNTWLPLQQSDVISMADLRGKIPGIDPVITQKMIDEEKLKNIELYQSGFSNLDDKADDKKDNINDKGAIDEKRSISIK